MNYEYLKRINDITYDNFESLKNNIKNQDKNINNIFRITAEGLLKYINDKYSFVSSSEGFYNRIMNNQNFLSFMLNEYKCDKKILVCLNLIRETGNQATHNQLKIFEVNDVKEKYTRIVYLVQKILQYECHINLNMTKEKINKELDMLFNSKKDENEINEINKDEIYKFIEQNEAELKIEFESLKEKQEFCNKNVIEKYKMITSGLVELTLHKNNLSNIEELKIGQNNELYKLYYSLDDLLENQEDDFDSLATIMDCSYTLSSIYYSFKQVRIFEWLLENIVVETSSEEKMYYEEIANVIEELSNEEKEENDIKDVVYYVNKQKGFFVNGREYFEIEIRSAIDYGNRANKKIVYSKERIRTDYALQISLDYKVINFLEQDTEIFVIKSSQVSIRPCELINFANLVLDEEIKINISRSQKYYKVMMDYLNNNNCNLLDIVTSNDEIYEGFIDEIWKVSHSIEIEKFLTALSKSRNIILSEIEESGHNVLRYILGNMNNSVIKKQFYNYQKEEDYRIGTTKISKKSLQFDRKPYSFDLKKHKPQFLDIARCIPSKLYKDDLIARQINKYCKDNQTIFTPIDKIKSKNIISHIDLYNLNIYSNSDSIKIYEDKYLYRVREYETLKYIINFISNNTNCNNENNYYKELKEQIDLKKIDDEKKLNIINNAFNNSKMLLIYGEAGSGKTELMCNYLTNIFKNESILFLANTHSALNNMKKRVKECVGNLEEYNFEFNVVSKVVNSKSEYRFIHNVVIIDECKVISNRDIKTVFDKISFDYCVLAGDVRQIDAIELGNWFEVCQECANESQVKLEKNHRTIDNTLLDIWDKVRKFDKSVYDDFEKNNIVEKLSPKIFEPLSEEEIILCLNYSGKYGINKINSYFQNHKDRANAKTIFYNMEKYKEGDQIVFNNDATEIYEGIIYNNLKGRIKRIDEDEQYMYFVIRVETYIDKMVMQNLKCIMNNKKDNWSTIELKINKYKDNHDDRNDKYCVVPFDIAYARSIHKAQGLEYDTVKVIITPESEEIINNAIFYTAITRAKKQLKIYYVSKESFEKLNLLEQVDDKYDYKFIKEIEGNN